MSDTHPPTLDPVAAARWARLVDAETPWLHEEVARRMAQRLDWIMRTPTRWLHWAPLRGGLQTHAALCQRYPQAQVYAYEPEPAARAHTRQRLAPGWWPPRRWRQPAHEWALPADRTVDLIWSNMALHAHADPQALLRRWATLLGDDGFLMFSCFGPDTLRELRALHRHRGWPPPAHAYTDMHDWGDMLLQSGFAEPVMDMEVITLAFPSAQRLLQELRTLGRNLHVERHPALRGRRWRQQWLAAVAEALANPAEGRQLTLTFEIVYGHAFKGRARTPASAKTAIPLTDLRRQLSHRKP